MEPRFADWYRLYPRKVGRKRAAIAFEKAIRCDEHLAILVLNTVRWAEDEFSQRATDRIPYPATFLNNGDWHEPPPVNRDAPARHTSEMAALEEIDLKLRGILE